MKKPGLSISELSTVHRLFDLKQQARPFIYLSYVWVEKGYTKLNLENFFVSPVKILNNGLSKCVSLSRALSVSLGPIAGRLSVWLHLVDFTEAELHRSPPLLHADLIRGRNLLQERSIALH